MISVLFVDDEPALLEIGRLFLERSGEMTVTSARSVSEALKLVKNNKFDVIVTDFEMPDIDGLVFLKTLRAEGNRVPLILFTGKGRERVAMEALNSGADFYLIKGEHPKLQFAELNGMIHQAVKRGQMEESLPVSPHNLADIIDNIPVPTFAIDTRGTVISWNTAMETLTGVKAADILNTGDYEYALPFYGQRRPVLIDLVLQNDETFLSGHYMNIRKEGESYIAEAKRVHLNGKEVFLWAKATRITGPDGNLLGAIESIRDVTDIKRSASQQEQKTKNVQSFGLVSRFLGTVQGAWYTKGVDLYARQGRYEEALLYFDRTIEMKEDHAGAWKAKGICLKELGRFEEALPCFDRAVALAPADLECHYYRGETLEKIGKIRGDTRCIEGAVRSFERVIMIDPDNLKAWNYCGLCYKELGKTSEARRCFDHAEKLAGQSGEI
ncbi:MAG: response regulator [Methanomicrobiales archaeon]|nr:response regulator [Methanomicrobiales archaeon]